MSCFLRTCTEKCTKCIQNSVFTDCYLQNHYKMMVQQIFDFQNTIFNKHFSVLIIFLLHFWMYMNSCFTCMRQEVWS